MHLLCEIRTNPTHRMAHHKRANPQKFHTLFTNVKNSTAGTMTPAAAPQGPGRNPNAAARFRCPRAPSVSGPYPTHPRSARQRQPRLHRPRPQRHLHLGLAHARRTRAGVVSSGVSLAGRRHRGRVLTRRWDRSEGRNTPSRLVRWSQPIPLSGKNIGDGSGVRSPSSRVKPSR